MKDSKKLFNYGDSNKRSRSIKIAKISEVDVHAIVQYAQRTPRR